MDPHSAGIVLMTFALACIIVIGTVIYKSRKRNRNL